jgi:hypothetical protein
MDEKTIIEKKKSRIKPQMKIKGITRRQEGRSRHQNQMVKTHKSKIGITNKETV